jgi:hypothetical protein
MMTGFAFVRTFGFARTVLAGAAYAAAGTLAPAMGQTKADEEHNQ